MRRCASSTTPPLTAVNYTASVCGLKSRGDLSGKAEQETPVQALSPENRVERLPLHQLGDQEVLFLRFNELKQTSQIGMADARYRRDRVLNTPLPLRIAGREEFECDKPIGLRVARLL